MESLATALVLIAAIAYIGFRHFLRHQRRVMVHRERLAALEKGVELPPVEQEIKRSNWSVQRFLLLAGLAWISIGIGASVVLSEMLSHKSPDVPPGTEFIGVGFVALGVSHLIVYWVGRKKDQ